MPKRRDEQAPYWQQLRVAERGIIEFALEHGVTIRGTASLLGVSPNFLGERMHKLGVPVPDVRPGPKPGTKRPAAPKLRVVDGPPPDAPDEGEDDDEGTDADSANGDVLEDETEEGQDDDEEGDPWDEDEDEDEDEDDGDGDGEDANAQGN